MRLRKLAIFCFLLGAFLFWNSYTLTETAASDDEEGWSTIKSAYFTIYYSPAANLKRLYNRVNGRSFSVAHQPPRLGASTPEDKLAYRLDMIFSRVQEILGIYLANVHVNIRIYENNKDLDAQFRRLARSTGEVESFYVHSYNTIYTSERNISDSVIAHEMTHALVDHYFSVTPPGANG
jgi:hypothetical protein